jgi:hypothetical protein
MENHTQSIWDVPQPTDGELDLLDPKDRAAFSVHPRAMERFQRGGGQDILTFQPGWTPTQIAERVAETVRHRIDSKKVIDVAVFTRDAFFPGDFDK